MTVQEVPFSGYETIATLQEQRDSTFSDWKQAIESEKDARGSEISAKVVELIANFISENMSNPAIFMPDEQHKKRVVFNFTFKDTASSLFWSTISEESKLKEIHEKVAPQKLIGDKVKNLGVEQKVAENSHEIKAETDYTKLDELLNSIAVVASAKIQEDLSKYRSVEGNERFNWNVTLVQSSPSASLSFVSKVSSSNRAWVSVMTEFWLSAPEVKKEQQNSESRKKFLGFI